MLNNFRHLVLLHEGFKFIKFSQFFYYFLKISGLERKIWEKLKGKFMFREFPLQAPISPTALIQISKVFPYLLDAPSVLNPYEFQN